MAGDVLSDKGIIEHIEGIGKTRGRKLIAAGVRTLADLEHGDIQELASRTGISRKLLARYVCMAALQRIDGIDKQFAEALVLMKADSFSSLASMNPEVILENMRRFDQEDVIPEVPSLPDVMKWQEESAKRIVPDPYVKYGSVRVFRHSSDRVVFADRELAEMPDGITLTITKFYKTRPVVRLTCCSHQYVPAPGYRVIDRTCVPAEDVPAKKQLLDRLTVKEGRLADDLPEWEKLGLLAQQFPTMDLLREIIFAHHVVIEVEGKGRLRLSKPEERLCNVLKSAMLTKVAREVRKW